MALPASGPISMSMVRTELENTGTTSNVGLSQLGSITVVREAGFVPINQNSTSKPNLTSPYQISEWYSYNHTQNGTCSGTSFTTPTIGGAYIYYRINVTGGAGNSTNISVNSSGYAGGQSLRCNIYSTYPFTNTGALTGTPLSALTFTSNTSQTYTYTLSTSSQVLYFVIWDNSII
jgi:hypothetical protein